MFLAKVNNWLLKSGTWLCQEKEWSIKLWLQFLKNISHYGDNFSTEPNDVLEKPRLGLSKNSQPESIIDYKHLEIDFSLKMYEKIDFNSNF